MAIAKAITPGANHATVLHWRGFSVKEDAAAAAVIEFRSLAVDGTVLWYLNLASGESASIMFPQHIVSQGGVYVKEVSGSITGSLLSDE